MNCNRAKESDRLKEFWDKKLEESGFQDIEAPGKWQWHSRYFVARYPSEKFSAQQEYYLMATSFLNEYAFETPLDLEVWKRHSDGIVPVQISKELKELGLKANKDTIYAVIRRLEKIMKLWIFK